MDNFVSFSEQIGPQPFSLAFVIAASNSLNIRPYSFDLATSSNQSPLPKMKKARSST